jgi:hypothetical protein
VGAGGCDAPGYPTAGVTGPVSAPTSRTPPFPIRCQRRPPIAGHDRARPGCYLACTPTNGLDVFVGDADELAEVRWLSVAEAHELLPGMFERVHRYLIDTLGR